MDRLTICFCASMFIFAVALRPVFRINIRSVRVKRLRFSSITLALCKSTPYNSKCFASSR
ncbi:hypothetical protein DERP_003136 [Dermatophagoides pteronyssinus]|uniref:Uncharacterized protein n=1 Tax=Dermatophagoides pteronyssinus TaxID=6956 RepID=A0ABQ8JJ74_DERPT|nr:hypothetical protein DERP_003136 [Dermatophagoides pteronyssinus]